MAYRLFVRWSDGFEKSYRFNIGEFDWALSFFEFLTQHPHRHPQEVVLFEDDAIIASHVQL